MSGIPISLMPLVLQPNATDKIPLSQGVNLGDNKSIEWQQLVNLLSSLCIQAGQTSNYTNTNTTPVVIPNFYTIIPQGKWLLTFTSCIGGNGITSDLLSYYLATNSNVSLVSYDASDVSLLETERTQSYPITGLGIFTIATQSFVLTVPVGEQRIIKPTFTSATGVSYTVYSRVLTAQKTI